MIALFGFFCLSRPSLFNLGGDLLEHHLPHGGGHRLPRAVVPDELGILVRSLEDVHRRLGVVPHGVHEHAREEADQSQANLVNERKKERNGNEIISRGWILSTKQVCDTHLGPDQLVRSHFGEELSRLCANLRVSAVTEEIEQVDESPCWKKRKLISVTNCRRVD